VADDSRTNRRAHAVGLYRISFSPFGDPVVCRGDETVLSAILRSGAKVLFGWHPDVDPTSGKRICRGLVYHVEVER